ncbi:hypothetical protein [Nisaea nitritireducens]|uniref:hypothetical protein n=1 Tax=Nisaea nitritireducens TaxID=568392 RepID=UPI0018669BDE|nr:hypothetical protein [Nisaea nitritireducens]
MAYMVGPSTEQSTGRLDHGMAETTELSNAREHLKYSLCLYGAFSLNLPTGKTVKLGVKQQAMVALLATGANGTRTRSWLQSQLWGNVAATQAAASLRSALAGLRQALGSDARSLLLTSRDRVTLSLDRLNIVGTPRDGEFLEGLDVKYEEGFDDWLRQQRSELEANSGSAVPIHPRSTLQPVENPPSTDLGIEYAVEQLNLLPFIGVLPFQCRHTGDQATALGDAIAEDISRTLSRTGTFSVISHLSARNYSSRLASLQEVTRNLSVDYILTGELDARSSEFGLTIDMHQVRTGTLLWSREFSAETDDFLHGGVEISREIARYAAHSVLAEALKLIRSNPLPTLACHEMLMGAIALMYRGKLDDFVKSRELLAAAIERAPDRPIPQAWFGMWHVLKVQKGFSSDIRIEAEGALDRTERALDLDPQCPVSLSFNGMAQSHFRRRMDVAKERYRGAIDSDPNCSLAWLLLGVVQAFCDQGDEAVQFTDRARRLSPLDPQRYHYDSLSATAHLSAGNYQMALTLADSSLRHNRFHPSTLRVKTIAQHRLGRFDEARLTADELMRIEPRFRVSSYLAEHPAGAFATGRDWASALKEAGVPH